MSKVTLTYDVTASSFKKAVKQVKNLLENDLYEKSQQPPNKQAKWPDVLSFEAELVTAKATYFKHDDLSICWTVKVTAEY